MIGNQKNPQGGKKRKIIWTIIIILIIIALVWLLIFILRDRYPDSDQRDIYSINDQPVFEPISPVFEEPDEIQREESVEFTVKNLAKNFTARFGSWSTDNRGQNLTELLTLSSARMQNYLNEIDVDYEVVEFSGVTTKSLSAQILFLDEDDGSADVLVQTQRIETKADLSQNIYYQDIELSIIKSGNNWLVDQVEWQEV